MSTPEVEMARQSMRTRLPVGCLVLFAVTMLSLSGCGGSSSPQSDLTGTTIRVVFPNQGAALSNGELPGTDGIQGDRSKTTFVNILSDLVHFYEVTPAYAQAVPPNVAKLTLTVTGPDFSQADLDRLKEVSIPLPSGRVTVDVPTGDARVFKVQAFPSGSPIPNFSGDTPPINIPPTGASVTVNMRPIELDSVQVTPTNPSIALGTTQQFTAIGIFTDGSTQNLTSAVLWASLAPGLAAISNAPGSQDLATAGAVGSTTISATSGNIRGETILTVSPAALVSVQVTPTNPTIPLGLTQQFTAIGIFTDATTHNLTTTVTWTSSDETVATISNAPGSQGLATSIAVGGPITIRATKAPEGISGETDLTVTPAIVVTIEVAPTPPLSPPGSLPVGLTQQFIATGIFTDQTTRNLTQQVLWESSAPGIATVSNAAGSQGLATAVAVGSTTISATFQGVTGPITGTAPLSVSAAIVTSIEVAPPTALAFLGSNQQFRASGFFTDNSTRDITSEVLWASSAPGIATISNAAGSQGLATAVDVGSTTISATKAPEGSATPPASLSGPSWLRLR
jgi:hypothetical protein